MNARESALDDSRDNGETSPLRTGPASDPKIGHVLEVQSDAENLPSDAQGWRLWPKQVFFIMGNEVCERFSFYGMRAILVVYMTGSLGMQTANAESAFHVFTAACYLLPLAGAWLADNIFGKYHVILYLSIVYCSGHAVLALFDSRLGLFFGLALISVGTGGIKPCVSALVGDQFPQGDSAMLASIFASFYWCINLGSFFSMASIPIVLKMAGSSLAFAIPGVFMALALLVFLAGRKLYIMLPPAKDGTARKPFHSVVWHCIQQTPDRRPGENFWAPAYANFSQLEIDTAQSVISLLGLFGCISVFQALFDQNGSTWVVQGTHMNLNVFGWEIPPAQMQAWNPVLVLTLIPFFESVVYPWWAKRVGHPIEALQKMRMGMFLAAAPFLYLSLLQVLLDHGKQPHILWQAPAFLVLTASEVLISISGLQFAYSQAPANMKSTILSLLLLTLFVGNSLDALIMKINYFNEFWSFIFFASIMLVTACLFVFLTINYDVKDFSLHGVEKESEDCEMQNSATTTNHQNLLAGRTGGQ